MTGRLIPLFAALALSGAAPAQGPARLATGVVAASAVLPADGADRLSGRASRGGLRGSMVMDLLAVDGDSVAVRVTFGAGLHGTGNLRGRVRGGAVHLNGLMHAQGARFDMALRAQPRDDGGFSGVYELSEQQTRQRQTGSFSLAAVDSR